MKWMGDTDNEKKVIRINKKLHKKEKSVEKIMGRKKRKAELLDTIVHEKMHADHPKMHEKTVRKQTKKKLPLLGKVKKSKLYGSIATT
jgi:hypothetical protein